MFEHFDNKPKRIGDDLVLPTGVPELGMQRISGLVASLIKRCRASAAYYDEQDMSFEAGVFKDGAREVQADFGIYDFPSDSDLELD